MTKTMREFAVPVGVITGWVAAAALAVSALMSPRPVPERLPVIVASEVVVEAGPVTALAAVPAAPLAAR